MESLTRSVTLHSVKYYVGQQHCSSVTSNLVSSFSVMHLVVELNTAAAISSDLDSSAHSLCSKHELVFKSSNNCA
jgi:hypothetical protein